MLCKASPVVLVAAFAAATLGASADVTPGSGYGSAASNPGASSPGLDASGSVSGAAAPGAAQPYTGDTAFVHTSLNYTIRAGDLVDISVFGEPSLTQPQARVLPDGTVTLPLVGAVRIAGSTPRAAAARIDTALNRYLRKPQVTVSVLQVAPFEVLVLGGGVRAPGKYVVQPESHLTDVLAAAGGLVPSTAGDFGVARMTSGSAVREVSLEKLLHDGDVTQNLPIDNGETVYVPGVATIQVQVAGAVDHPGLVTVRDGDRMTNALVNAGIGGATHADLNRVQFRRVGASGAAQSQTLDFYKIVANKDVNADPVLQRGDLIVVPTSANANGGNTFQQVLYGLTSLFRI